MITNIEDFNAKLNLVLQVTEQLLTGTPDPDMGRVHKQLLAMADWIKGEPDPAYAAKLTMGRILAYSFTPAPNKELANWVEGCLELWAYFKKWSNGNG